MIKLIVDINNLAKKVLNQNIYNYINNLYINEKNK